ncbi:DUF4062 domain-containing protein [Hymenobacter ruber]
MNRLNVFVSSTCYDLSQIRADLSDFIESSGHTPVLSEFDNFPINPQDSTVKNCINAVKENADVLVLIVGSRYGYIIETGKSITNTEFLTAKQKGIPVFVFVDKKTISALSFWKANKDADFSKFVHSTKIFEFVSDIRDNSQLWTFEFEKAQDIVSILKIQFSYLFKNALRIRSKYERQVPSIFKLDISDDSLKILLDKETLYEYEFFAQALIDEMQKKESVLNDYKYNIRYGVKSVVNGHEAIADWSSSRLKALMNLIGSLSELINRAFMDFIGAPGQASDLSGLYYVARTYAKIYEELINWSIEINCTSVQDDCKDYRDKLAKLANSAIKSTGEFPAELRNRFATAKADVESGATDIKLNISLSIGVDDNDMALYSKEIEILHNKYSA